MTEQEIEKTRWREFCDEFTRKHHGSLIAVDALETDSARGESPPPSADRRPAQNDALQAITAVPNPHGSSILIQAGDGDQKTRVLIEQPVRLRLRQSGDGGDEALHVDGADGRTIRLAFRTAPEQDAAGAQA